MSQACTINKQRLILLFFSGASVSCIKAYRAGLHATRFVGKILQSKLSLNETEDHRRYRRNFCSLIFISFITPFHGFITNQFYVPARPVWLLSSNGSSALHRYRRGQGFESRTSLNFFQAFYSPLPKLQSATEMIFFHLIFHPAVFIHDFHIYFIYLK